MNGKIKNVNLRQSLFVAVLTVATLVACSSAPTGTYTDVTGAFVLVLNSGGSASFSLGGQPSMACTYTSDGKTVSVTCPGQAGALVLTIQSDGSLAGPPGSFMPPLKKK